MTMTLTQVTTGGVDENINIDSNTLKVDGTNNRVGIGTAAPSGLLHLAASSSPSLYFEDTGSSNTLSRVYKSGSALTFNSRHTSAGQFVFNSENSGGTVTERMRINSSGNVGIGTGSSIDELFHMQTSSATARLKIESTTADSYPGVRLTNPGRTYDLQIVSTSGDFRIFDSTGSSERMRIDTSGNMLVGLTSAVGIGGTPADSNSTEIGRGYINISRDDTQAADHILFGKNGSIASSIGTSTTNSLIFKTGTTERMRIDSSGRVLINDTAAATADSFLTVKNGSGACEVNIMSSPSHASVLNLGDTGDYNIGRIKYEQSDNSLQFHTNNSDRARIDSSGRLLVGTTTARTTGNGGYARLQVVSPSGSSTSVAQVIAAKFQGNSSASSSECLLACAAGYSISANDTEGHALFGAVREGNANNAGFIVKTGTANNERFRVTSGGVINTNGVQNHYARGSTSGTSTFSLDYLLGSTQSALVIAAFNHYGLFGYGCTRISFAATGSSFSTEAVSANSTGNGGSWSITKPNNSTLRITKTAGSYNGGGNWFVHIIAS